MYLEENTHLFINIRMKTTSPTSTIAPPAAEPAISKMEKVSNIYEQSNQNAAEIKCS